MILVVFLLVSDAPSILRVQIVVVVVLAILVPGWVSHQDPADFNCEDAVLVFVLWHFIIIVVFIG